MLCCLNPHCQKPDNPDGTKLCQSCGSPLGLLRNHYRPMRLLSSEGGFGRTYLAADLDKLDEICVIKQLAPQAQDTASLQKAKELFDEEARRLQELGQHPQIPTLYAYFQEGGHLYLVQQFIKGETLERVQSGNWSESQIRELLEKLLPILKFIHERGVIHRDLKPPNIIRTPEGQFVLIDFGASKQLTATVSAPGSTIGTFGYGAIEQMRDSEAYPASDLFGLGATCFCLLTGASPNSLFLNRGYDWLRSWRQHLSQPISEELERVLDKLLQKERSHRYREAAEVLGDLERKAKAQPQPQAKTQQRRASQQKNRQSSRLGLLAKITGLALSVALGVYVQMLGYYRYGVFPFNPLVFIVNPLLQNTLTGHPESVNSVAISPDGQALISGSWDNTIKIWNLKTGKLQNTLTGHTTNVNSVAISPDGKTLVSGSWDNTIKTWNLETVTPQSTLAGHTGTVWSVAISPDGQTLVSGSWDKTIKIWNLETGTLQNTLTGHTTNVNSVAISPDGKTLVSGSVDKTIKIWNLETGTLPNTLTGHTNTVFSVAISPDGKTLVSGSADKTIKVWNLKTGKLQNTLIGHADAVNSVAISPDGQVLVSGSWDKTIKVWNLKTGRLQNTLIGHTGSVRSVAISPDGQTIVSGSRDKTIKIWRMP
ncbi:MAG: protein kinase [Oscillatoria sp. SIO1A7]|nr:protein kinase [Oscillatoria sp. SIO1A7]